MIVTEVQSLDEGTTFKFVGDPGTARNQKKDVAASMIADVMKIYNSYVVYLPIHLAEFSPSIHTCSYMCEVICNTRERLTL